MVKQAQAQQTEPALWFIVYLRSINTILPYMRDRTRPETTRLEACKHCLLIVGQLKVMFHWWQRGVIIKIGAIICTLDHRPAGSRCCQQPCADVQMKLTAAAYRVQAHCMQV